MDDVIAFFIFSAALVALVRVLFISNTGEEEGNASQKGTMATPKGGLAPEGVITANQLGIQLPTASRDWSGYETPTYYRKKQEAKKASEKKASNTKPSHKKSSQNAEVI